MVVVFRHNDFVNKEIFAIPHWVTVDVAAANPFRQPVALVVDAAIEMKSRQFARGH